MKDDTDELALAAYAAETGSHVLIAPREARFARFRERFDGPAFRKRLAEAEICWLARSDPAFPHAFPYWGTDNYWEGQLADINEQVRLLQDSD